MMKQSTNPGPHAARRRSAWSIITAVGVGLMLLAGCSSSNSDPQNFNTLVQHWLKRVQGGHSVMNQARNLFATDNPDTQREAIAWMSQQKWGHEKPYMDAYRLAENSPSPLVRGQAMLALGTSGQASVAPDLERGLTDKSKFVRWCAAMAAAHVKNPVLIPDLIKCLQNDADAQVRIDAAKALQAYKTRLVIETLINALDDRNVAIVQAAWNDLTIQTGQKFPQHSGPWEQWLQTHRKEFSGTG
ncbi:MAG: HEAT repeat domain-containing protein [Phycisphaerae bacterium]